MNTQTPTAPANQGGKQNTSHKLERVSNAFSVVQTVLIMLMAKDRTPTADIAGALGVDRSYVIRLAAEGVVLAPANSRERRLYEVANNDTFAGKFKRLGLGGLLTGENTEVVLAGNAESPRPKLGPLVERRAAKDAKAQEQASKAKAPELPLAPQPHADSPTKKSRKAKAPDLVSALDNRVLPEAPAKVSKPRKAKAPEPAPEPAPAPAKAAGKPRKAKAPTSAPITDTASAADIMSA